MKTLVLKLKGPLQSWGDSSRYRTRSTRTEPTKSGVLGLLAAAQGRARTDNIADLAALEFGVRVDQPGVLERDFQTAREEKATNPRLSYRYFLADAVFIAVVSGPDTLIESLAQAVKSPQYPLFLGRRSCPAGPDMLLGVRDGGVEEALRAEPWHASEWHRCKRAEQVQLPLFRDARDGEEGDSLRDSPQTFSQENRSYHWRTVFEAEPVSIANPLGRKYVDPFLDAVRSL